MSASDGEPTDRSLVLEPEIVLYQETLFNNGMLNFELYYSDWSMVAGSTPGEWRAAPSQDVQILIWQSALDESLHVVHGHDVVWLKKKKKYGKWMDDMTFWQMLKEVPLTSKLFTGE